MTDLDPDAVAAGAAVALAHRLLPCWQSALGADLLGVYLIGSLAHGGFNRRYSDIDVAVVSESGVAARTLQQVAGEAAALSPEWGPRLSVFWSDRGFTVGRFPALDRLDYLDRPTVLMERERVRPPRPTLGEIRAYLRGAPFAGWAERARLFAASAALDARDRKAYLRALLYPARFCLGYVEGRMGSNDDAVAYLRARTPRGLDLEPIEQALLCRRAAADPDHLFALRAALPAQVAACAALFAESLG